MTKKGGEKSDPGSRGPAAASKVPEEPRGQAHKTITWGGFYHKCPHANSTLERWTPGLGESGGCGQLAGSLNLWASLPAARKPL